MSSTADTYQLSDFTAVRQNWRNTRVLRDGEDPSKMRSPNLEAHVASGDYFISLATTLDSLNQEIADYATRSRLEDVVSDLIYLYDHFNINKKDEN